MSSAVRERPELSDICPHCKSQWKIEVFHRKSLVSHVQVSHDELGLPRLWLIRLHCTTHLALVPSQSSRLFEHPQVSVVPDTRPVECATSWHWRMHTSCDVFHAKVGLHVQTSTVFVVSPWLLVRDVQSMRQFSVPVAQRNLVWQSHFCREPAVSCVA